MKKLLIIVFFLTPFFLFSQEDTQKNWAVDGYVKNLQALYFLKTPLFDTLLLDNLIHNRINFRWYVNDHFTFRADMRNRIFYGDLVKLNPNFGKDVDNANNDFFDLSATLIDRGDLVVHSMLDRLYLEYIKNKWEVRAGRQRINWGINSIWNPNDIFNAYSFTDFDYEERPGSDAVRVKYYTGFASSIEIAVKAFDDPDNAVGGLLWKFNKQEYDLQLLAGVAQQDIVLGGGWAGNIKNASFKGEFSYFHSLQDSVKNSFAGTLASEYSFEKGLFLNGGFLYNSNGSKGAGSTILFNAEISAKNLYPYKYAVFAQAGRPLTPILTAGLAVIYSPVKTHSLFINPTLSYSVAQNWDLDLVAQIVFEKTTRYESPTQVAFLRLKFSY
jgi:hypothetical protein